MWRKHYKKRVMWTEKEEEMLLELWLLKIEELQGPRKNTHIYKEMANELSKNNINFSGLEIKSKINNLTTKYKKEKLALSGSEGSSSTWPLYNKINCIIGNSKIVQVQSLLEESIMDIDDIDVKLSPVSHLSSDSRLSPSPQLQLLPNLESESNLTSNPNLIPVSQTLSEFQFPPASQLTPSTSLSIPPSPLPPPSPHESERNKFENKIFTLLNDYSKNMDRLIAHMEHTDKQIIDLERQKVSDGKELKDGMLYLLSQMEKRFESNGSSNSCMKND